MPVLESIGVAALGWVASPLVAKLLDEGFASLGIDAEEKLQKLRVAVPLVLKSVIEKAEDSDHRSEVEGWLQRLKDAYDGVEDALDLLNYHRLRRKAAAAASVSGGTESPTIRVPKRVQNTLSPKKIKLKWRLNKLEKIAGEAQKLRDLLGIKTDQTTPASDSRQTVSLPPRKVLGRDEDRAEIIRLLKMEPAAAGIPIIAVVGRPGVGKTTLAQYVCEQLRSESEDRHFHPIMWVYASRNFDATGIMRDIIQQASMIGTEPQNPVDHYDRAVTILTHLRNLDTMVGANLNSAEALRLKMNEKLSTTKFLLVMDDVWCDGEEHKRNWDTLFRCLSECCSPGSKILVTSQTDDAPGKIGAANGASVEHTCHLEDLEDDNFADLFIHHALPSGEIDSRVREEIEEKCETIAKKLGKDPTVAKMVGETIALKLADLLRSQGDWRTYLEAIAQKDWSGDKTKALAWSYQHLPAHLQRCFSYCSLYPRGYKFRALELVQLWTAQGFIKPDDQNATMEDAGISYLEMLVSRFYIQCHDRVSHSFATGKPDGWYTLHELLYDLAEEVTRSDCVRIKGNHRSGTPPTIRHLSIPADELNENKKNICKLEKLRTLIVTKGENVVSDENVATDIFKSLKKLRVLLVSGLNLEKGAKFVSEMKHLRILQVSGTSEFVLPESVSALYQLQVLAVENTSLLPTQLNNLVSLRNAIFRTPFLTFVTNEDLQMSQGEKTSVKQVTRKRMQKWFLHQHCESSVSNENGLMIMSKRMQTWSIYLRKGSLVNNEASSAERNKSVPAAANVDITAAWERWLEMHEGKMESIYSRQNEAKLLLPSTLTKLSLEGCNITDRALSACLQTLTSLTYLTLAEISTITCLPSADVLGNLTSLQDVALRGCWAVTSLGGIRSLAPLRNLLLSGCPCLEGETASLPSSLQCILFESCADVDVILANADLPHLSYLLITRCHLRTTLLQFGNLRSLYLLGIEHCPGLSLLEGIPELHSLEFLILQNCPNLQPVLNFPISLKSLLVWGCPIVELQSMNVDPVRACVCLVASL